MTESHKLTVDGFEYNFQVNYLGHFYLTSLLLDLIKKTPDDPRIINLTSRFHRKNLGARINWNDINFNTTEQFVPLEAYCQSKLMILMSTLHLADRLKSTAVGVYAVDPGIVSTDLTTPYYSISGLSGCYYRLFWKPYIKYRAKSPRAGAQTALYCALSHGIRHLNGRYFK